MFDPFGNQTSPVVPDWHDQPFLRGTSDIISSGLITLIFCLWTALHLNLPSHREARWMQLSRKALYLLLGLIAPEMIAYTAWYQHRAASQLTPRVALALGQPNATTWFRKLLNLYTRHLKNTESDPSAQNDDLELHSAGATESRRRHRWTAVHSFYAIMGGFAFDTTSAKTEYIPRSRQRLTLTPSGLLYVLEHEEGLFPDISREHIWDKSKASGLVKFIVCLQAVWFLGTVVVRFAQRLAISLLELNVAGHAICALLIYSLWWHKPLDITEPTILSGEMAHEMCALMCMRSGNGSYPELPECIKYGSKGNFVDEARNSDSSSQPLAWYWWPLFICFSPIIFAFGVCIHFCLFIRQILRDFGVLDPVGEEATIHPRLEWTDGNTDEKGDQSNNTSSSPLEGNVVDEQDRSARTEICTHAVHLKYPALSPSTGTETIDQPLDNLQSIPEEEESASGHIRISTSSQTPAEPIQTHGITQSLEGFSLTFEQWDWEKKRLCIRQPAPDYAPAWVHLSATDVERWRLCARALRRYCPSPKWLTENGQRVKQLFPAEDTVCDRLSNWPRRLHSYHGDSGGESAYMFFGFALAGFLYGGLHLLAWNATFSSKEQRFFWRFAGCMIAASGPIVGAAWGVSWIYRTLGLGPIVDRLKINHGTLHWICATTTALAKFLAGGTLAMLFLVYIFARGYLVVESCIQLGYLPSSAYIVPDWSKYYPHIS